jgi:hypothetical protein
LMARGLVVQVLGSCEITSSGQLTYHRQQFLRAPRTRVARVSRDNPLFLQEMRFGVQHHGSRLSGVAALRRRLDARIRQAIGLPHWLMRLASETASPTHPAHESDDIPGGGPTQGENKTD